MGDNERRRRYNQLSQIIKGKVGKATARERIDYFIDLAVKAGKHHVGPHRAGRVPLQLSDIPSVLRATVASQRAQVREGLKSDHEHAQHMGRQAQAWLLEKTGQVPIIEDGELKGWRYADD